MDLQAMKRDLHRGLRATGLPVRPRRSLENLYLRWLTANGKEWFNDRMKSLTQWYESYLTGEPVPPPWFKHTPSGMPVGILGWLFKRKNPGQVLLALSANTLLREEALSPAQEEKFFHGLAGNGYGGGERFPLGLDVPTVHRDCRLEAVTLPDLLSMTGNTAPIGEGRIHLRTEDRRLEAWSLSWDSVFQGTLDFLERLGRLDMIPLKRELTMSYGSPCIKGGRYVGMISIIQEPCLKARIVANPNRITQHFLRPLEKTWESIARYFPSDCTEQQADAVSWAQRKLQEGLTLSGSDLTSATDLLSLDVGLGWAEELYTAMVADLCFQGKQTPALISGSEVIQDALREYRIHVSYFVDCARGPWFFRGGEVSWKQGQPLGLCPSFGLLAIMNNMAGYLAALRSGIPKEEAFDSFRVIGDDIIMVADMQDAYQDLITSIGGEINSSKTLVSNQVSEVAGRIVTPTRVFRKRYNWVSPSDDSFLEVFDSLGPSSLVLMRPRQRAMIETFKYVPRVVIDGQGTSDSWGEPLDLRVAWYYCQVARVNLLPDLKQETMEQQLLRLQIFKGGSSATDLLEMPWPWTDDYLSSIGTRPPKGDPRKHNGLTTLQWLESIANAPGFQDFETWKAGLVSDREVPLSE